MKAVVVDTENSANVIATWGVYEQNALEVIKHRQVITFSWHWLGDSGKPNVVSLPDFKSYKKNPDCNKELARLIHSEISKADIVIGQNVHAFDRRRINTEFIKHDLGPTPPHRYVDTLKLARHHFGFNFNSLKELAKFLKLPHKIDTGGYSLWKACAEGDLKAWARMSAYCQGDVITTEAAYLAMRPWDQKHPDMNLADNHVGCRVCRGTKKRRYGGYNFTKRGRARRWQCLCGHWNAEAMVPWKA